jgi:hypothetical protein
MNIGDSDLKVFDLAMVASATTRWSEMSRIRDMWRSSEALSRIAAERLEQRRPANKLVAATGIGSLGYHSDARVLDLLGLVDPVIARSGPPPPALDELALPGHQRTNAAYVLSRQPHYILIPEPSPQRQHLPAVLELWQSPQLARRYRWDPSLPGYRRVRRR